MSDVLAGKKILIVDDEPDVLETLEELLGICVVDSASDFDTAKRFLKNKSYDAAILDIMGVEGYDLLKLAKDRDLPVLMLTAHALSPNHLLKSIKGGAFAYIPKDELVDISFYLDDMIQAKLKNDRESQNWFKKLSPIFDKKFGSDWRIKHRRALIDLDLTHTREELEEIL
jgi:DNA-binding NtrC family response regulator